MMRKISDPMAAGVVHWLPGGDKWKAFGGDSSPGEVVAMTCVFVLGGEREVLPGWPMGAEHYSIVIQFETVLSKLNKSEIEAGDSHAKLDFLAKDIVAEQLHVDSRLLVMMGPDPFAEIRVCEIFFKK